jgi:hypothetical protein
MIIPCDGLLNPAPHHREAEILAIDLEHELALQQIFEHRLEFRSRSARGSNQRGQGVRRIA